MTKQKTGYIFRVALIGAPEIWRRIQIRCDWTLWELHEAIYEAYDRIDDHMFCFYFTKPGSRGRADRETRAFATERFCFRGSVDDWIHIGGPGPLAEQVEKYVKHLGRESMYELF